ncbi:MAG: methyltransferase domain-containing protein [Pseudomonadota bacterium]
MKDLHAFRAAAVEAAGGSSDEAIKLRVLDVLGTIGTCSTLLDFGAGKGDFLALLRERYPDVALTGADYLPRPANISQHDGWIQTDLNEEFVGGQLFDFITCIEVIEHLENPRLTMRRIVAALKPGGTLILTTPNQESIRSYAALVAGGHFAAFLGTSYPAHITALLRLDLVRICYECGLAPPIFSYTNVGGIPKMPRHSGQSFSFGLLKGRLFSDNLLMVTTKSE